MKPTLLILAAGMGSRYGSLKQLDELGPSGEGIIEFSVYDAIRAGFGKVVFVIRDSFEEAFRAKFDSKFQDKIQIEYAFQAVNTPIEGVKDFDVNATPTVIINNKKFEKSLNYKNLKKSLEKLI